MHELKYLAGYPAKIIEQVQRLITEDKLGQMLMRKYPASHDIRTDRALYNFAMGIKNEFLRTAQPLSKVSYDGTMHVVQHALGSHTFVSRLQGSKLKAKHEIRVASVFRTAPAEFLRMIVVHELAHLKEKEHNRAFYRLCEHMEPAYQQLEFDTRLYLTQMERARPLPEEKITTEDLL
ncbi:M48 family metallopeptidase [Geobacter sp. SVR]|uniref:M48 metallopeptidase family protein n=1 Tax=Geobacter sp. SVR TaxID=2495594 RepID=UPI00143F0056|nr:M48 family metallopeptidase [Geobacter sp. SVR]BCS54587.1 hypothetical protein GSVR_28950 [Geobacter sp. SVR]GCF86906.1 hypothetical protein GSbR_35060 [Geobacter sp. SVR]